ncbi:hypothetical protein OA542_01190 [Opitutae bacterium]|nr:hypothetical protein [Opitutae bacterium]
MRDKKAVAELFDNKVSEFSNRAGGYTRIYKLGQRVGDAAEMGLIELIDANDEGYPKRPKKKAAKSETKAKAKAESKAEEVVEDEEQSEATEESSEGVEPQAEIAEADADAEEAAKKD